MSLTTSILPTAFLARPLAHRALHDAGAGRVENAPAAIRAAVAAGYGIEVDVQRAADGQAVVFHDDTLDRLTDAAGPVRARAAAELGQTLLRGGRGDTIPTLAQVCDWVGGAMPLLIEIKDQDGALGHGVGPLEAAVADVLKRYSGPAAVMSFNPHSMAQMARFAPGLPRGLVTCDFAAPDWPGVPADRLSHLRAIADFDAVGAAFISHQATDLGAAPVAALRARKVPVLCWTIRSVGAEAAARKIADNITFEGYLPTLDGAA
ncbi:glycerophosphodiester phosphodiesterase family protein [Roseicitreum antarcticum]|uniref:Glycerophosphoryl diester phosphodiesterase n=1 Tax=Roseicitreum antarcticum TaxID=564137 RepID=A0A1H3AL83_9RHOB|nr:glycerophosphodiester phosphodiesterase family protein [Roseicitreum antarcticum]SDX30447.1 Glycerophosphoryl diester phosphodiesterase [Roseicitreum antarcticum]